MNLGNGAMLKNFFSKLRVPSQQLTVNENIQPVVDISSLEDRYIALDVTVAVDTNYTYTAPANERWMLKRVSWRCAATANNQIAYISIGSGYVYWGDVASPDAYMNDSLDGVFVDPGETLTISVDAIGGGGQNIKLTIWYAVEVF